MLISSLCFSFLWVFVWDEKFSYGHGLFKALFIFCSLVLHDIFVHNLFGLQKIFQRFGRHYRPKDIHCWNTSSFLFRQDIFFGWHGITVRPPNLSRSCCSRHLIYLFILKCIFSAWFIISSLLLLIPWSVDIADKGHA